MHSQSLSIQQKTFLFVEEIPWLGSGLFRHLDILIDELFVFLFYPKEGRWWWSIQI
jgi:hypothetical protein